MSRLRGFFAAVRAQMLDKPWLTIILLLAAQTLPAIIWSRELWYSDEVRHGNILQNLLSSDNWTVLRLNGRIYPDKPPLYFWFLALLSKLFQSDRPFIFFAGLALSAGMLLAATWWLARSVAHADKKVALAATLVLLTNFFFTGAVHWSRMDIMFSAWIVVSQICLFQAWHREKPRGWAVAGFALAGVAVLTKGPFGILFPFFTSLVFLVWRFGFKRGLLRLLRWDALLGLALALVIPAAWLLFACWRNEPEGRELVRLIVDDQSRRLTNSFMHRRPFYYYAMLLPVVWLPWSLLLCRVSWRCLFTVSFWTGLWANRRLTDAGTSYLWIMFLAAFFTLSCVSIKLEIYLAPILPPLALLTVWRLFSMPRPALMRIWAGISALALLIGAVVAALATGLFFPLPVPVRGGVAVAVVFALLGMVLFIQRRHGPARLIAILLGGMILFANLTALFVMPSFDPVMSPKALGLQIGEYARRSYFPAAYRLYPGILSYYARTTIYETTNLKEMEVQLEQHPKAVLLLSRKSWETWANKPPGMHIVSEKMLSDSRLLLVVRDGQAP